MCDPKMPVAGKTPVGESPEKLNRKKGRNENMKRRFWTGLLSFVMLWSLLPVSALAANGGAELETEVSTSKNSPVQVKKTINDDGTKLTLEAYVIDEVTQTSSTKPLDIVLVLDQSGSMAYNFDGNDEGSPNERCQYAMKQAVNSFIDKVGEQYSEKGDHRKDYDDAVVTVTGKKLKVTGFDYTANAVTKTTQGNKVSYSGSKLIVTIPIKPDTTCKTWRAGKNAYVTNDTVTNKAGLSGYTDKEGKTPLETVLSDSPEAMVTAYTVTYEVTGEAPETADYTDPRAYIKGQTADVLDAPKSPVEKDGFTYTFTGWQNDTAPAGKTIEIVDHDVVLTGTWSKVANEYTVTYVPYDEDSNHPDGTIQVPDSVKATPHK